MKPYEHVLNHMNNHELVWHSMNLEYEQLWPGMKSYGPSWTGMKPYEPSWTGMAEHEFGIRTYELVWNHMNHRELCYIQDCYSILIMFQYNTLSIIYWPSHIALCFTTYTYPYFGWFELTTVRLATSVWCSLKYLQSQNIIKSFSVWYRPRSQHDPRTLIILLICQNSHIRYI